jgi:alkanesulfonate monooxygenase SsuD/methylene tetrahydromethanopterin reductase-like flavin-dependent oxidoreductase (luciferase family)
MRGTALIGSPDTIRQRLAEIEAAGVQELMVGFVQRTNPEQLRRFAREFIA